MLTKQLYNLSNGGRTTYFFQNFVPLTPVVLVPELNPVSTIEN